MCVIVYHLLTVSALYLGSCNCVRHQPLCSQGDAAQSQLLLTLIHRQWAEPPHSLSSFHLVTEQIKLFLWEKSAYVLNLFRLWSWGDAFSSFQMHCHGSLAFPICTFKLSRQRKDYQSMLNFSSEPFVSSHKTIFFLFLKVWQTLLCHNFL